MTITRQEFDALKPLHKGYAVYMLGARDDEPNVPKSYTPTEDEREEYERGQQIAIQEVQDCP